MPAAKRKKKPDQIGGGKPGPGRPKGVPNKLNSDIRAAVIAAANHAGNMMKVDLPGIEELDGAEAYLTLLAMREPKTFGPILSKTFSSTIDISISAQQDKLVELLQKRRQALAEQARDITPQAEALERALNGSGD